MPITTNFALLNIDKPLGRTSHDIVNWVRRHLHIRKVGHSGTLDPLATGVLVICLGQATRLSSFVMNHDKMYEATVHFGIATDTYDAEGQPTTQSSATITLDEIEAVLPKFQGQINQVPPIYSAIKQGGQKLYEKARRGESVELTPRSVAIHHIAILDWEFPYLKIRVKCSPGTYIRSLAHDLGQQLGIGAHLAALRRTASGDYFHEENAVTLEKLEEAINAHTVAEYLLPPAWAVSEYLRVDLDDLQTQAVLQGKWIWLRDISEPFVCAYAPNGEFFALLEPFNDLWKPHKVFINPYRPNHQFLETE